MDTSRTVVGALHTRMAACSHEEAPAIYLGDLFLQGNVQVNWHRAPVVRGRNPFYGRVRVGWK